MHFDRAHKIKKWLYTVFGYIQYYFTYSTSIHVIRKVTSVSTTETFPHCHSDFIYVSTLQDLDHLEAIWELVQEWQENWDSWKVVTFVTLKTEDMALQAQGLLKRLNKVSREVKVRG